MDIETIELNGRNFRVLNLEFEQGDLEFVKLPTGVICNAEYNEGDNIPYDPQHDTVYITLPDGSSDELWAGSLAHYGIIPLCEIGVEPVSFTGVVTQSWVSGDFATVTLTVPLDQFEKCPVDRFGGRKLTCSVEEVS
jgi:hypothetical protein